MARITSLVRLLVRRPGEAWERLLVALEARVGRWFGGPGESGGARWSETLEVLKGWMGQELVQKAAEEAEVVAEETRERVEVLRGPIERAHNADIVLGCACYVLTRALRPRLVVETGVAYGVTTTCILRALERNGMGVLHSVDLPPLGDVDGTYVGILVPEHLRRRWVLYRGLSRKCLPKLMGEGKSEIGLFVHDSLHTYWNVRDELRLVTPHLGTPSAVLVDDVHLNRAFTEWVDQVEPAAWAVVAQEEKPGAFGMALFG